MKKKNSFNFAECWREIELKTDFVVLGYIPTRPAPQPPCQPHCNQREQQQQQQQ